MKRKLIVGHVASGCDVDDSWDFGCDGLREDRYTRLAASNRLARGRHTCLDDPDIFLGTEDVNDLSVKDLLTSGY